MRIRRGIEVQTPVRNASRLAGLRMLVVDDSDINREVAQRIFAGEGALVVLANDGQEAVDWLQEHADAVDIVLMDVQMPVLNGYEATRQIRRVPALSELPIVALTAGAFREQQEQAHESGMTSFISKPFDVDAAIALIVKLTGHTARPVAPETIVTAPLAANDLGDLPGIDLDKGLAIWRDEAAYKKFLRLFMSKYADVADQLKPLDQSEAQALVHKLKGAAANLALLDVAARAGDLEAAMHAGEALDKGIAKLQAAMNTVLNTLRRFAPEEAASAVADIRPEDVGAVDALLNKLLNAWSSESTKLVRQTISELSALVPVARLTNIQAAADNYEFRAGETATRQLREQLTTSKAVSR